jgi:hypothetical protein
MSQCHDTYSWDTYHDGHRAACHGTQCHDQEDSQPSKMSVNGPGQAEHAAGTADRELQPA